MNKMLLQSEEYKKLFSWYLYSFPTAIYREQLIELKACPEGLSFFDEIAPSGSLTIEWSPWLALMFSIEPKWYHWLQEKGLMPAIQAPASNLEQAQFYDAIIKYAKFSESSFKDSAMESCTFVGCDFSRCDFTNAILDNSDLSVCNFKYANFCGASVRDADLSGANIHEAFATDTADLSWAYYPEGELPSGWKRNKKGYLIQSEI